MLKTSSGSYKLSAAEMAELDRQHREAINQEQARRKLAEARNSAYEYTLKQLQIYFDEMEKAIQSLSGNFSKLGNRVAAGRLTIEDTLDSKQQ